MIKANSITILYKSIILLIISLSYSCSLNKGWVYKSNSYGLVAQKSKISNKTIAVLPFSDKRDNENSNKTLLYMIPLMPFGYQNYDSPETQQVHITSGLWLNYNPRDSFSNALVDELNSALFFKEAFSSNDYRNYDYFVKGQILSTDYHGKILSYGLSVYGPLLWYIGFPATYVENHLEVELSLYRTDGNKLIFNKKYKATPYEKTGWLYSLPSDFEYNTLLSGVYKEFLMDVSKEFDIKLDE
ncbi:MAG: hypothetical protein ISQ34_01630 [Rickettsiales bacterium]|nr:hypothetical protein [Rickettsiales bacterium]